MPHPDPEVRRLRQAAHRSFDRIWTERHMTRKEAYRWLAARLGVYEYEAHMGNMEDKDLLRRVVEEANEYMRDKAHLDFPDFPGENAGSAESL